MFIAHFFQSNIRLLCLVLDSAKGKQKRRPLSSNPNTGTTLNGQLSEVATGNKRMNEWMDGWMDEWMDEWMNGWMKD